MKSIGNSRGTLPSIRSIHENSYAWHHTSLDDLNKLLNVTPCTLGGVYRWMPLMYAARNGANESVIRRLIQEQPQAVRLMDCDGWLPIHYSSYTGNQEACKVLLEAYPNSIYVTTKRSTNSSDAYNSDEQKAPCTYKLYIPNNPSFFFSNTNIKQQNSKISKRTRYVDNC